MKIALYGMPCAGKSTLMDKITDAKVISGSQELRRLCSGSFSELPEEEKCQVRIRYTEYVNSLKDEMIISDGHYSFLENVVFTESDGDLYDVFIYLYCKPELLKERYVFSKKNLKYAAESIETIMEWQDYEIQSLRAECHKRNKDFYVVSDNESDHCKFYDFLTVLQTGFSSCKLAKDICFEIMQIYTNELPLYIVDGDKTMIHEDSYRLCCDGKTKVFDGNFYSGYQSFLFEKELQDVDISVDKISEIRINEIIYKEVAKNNHVVLSAGMEQLWKEIAAKKNLGTVFSNPNICADTKYFVIKYLRENGYTVYAYGDSKIDLYMLREANRGILYIGNRISRSLQKESISGLELVYNHSIVVLANEDSETLDDIALCKSNSGINGNKLAAAHLRLGILLGKRITQVFPEKNIAVLVLERGGRFFGDGIYIGAGGTFHTMYPKKEDIPEMDAECVIIVDSVINTGKSIMKIIERIKEYNPEINIIIAANVIQNDAVEFFKDYLVFAIRLSQNSFEGKNQVKQTGTTGPDTADRLFNLIESRFR